jgi:hypothetical protein
VGKGKITTELRAWAHAVRLRRQRRRSPGHPGRGHSERR